ncbi:MAG: amidohydrolase family protein [Bauldia sp.]|nr:amidohydrolase family protein [Bauldia sp.]
MYHVTSPKGIDGDAFILAPERVIDGTGEPFPGGTAVRVDRGLIAGVGPLETLHPGSVRTFHLKGASLLPGMIDCHGYLSVDPDRPDPMGGMHGEDLVARSFLAARHLSMDLCSGVTAIRVMGEGAGLDYRARQAIRDGVIVGPRLLCSGAPICPSFSHQAAPGGGVDGVEGVRTAVRRAVARGADWIKLVVTGGINAAGDRATTPLYTEAEVAVGLSEATTAGVPVAIAAHGGPAVAHAVALGARTVEHCALFEDAELEGVARAGATLTLTLSRFFLPNGIELSGRDVPGVLDRLMRARDHLAALVPKAVAHGVEVVLGTDNMHGALATDVRLFVELGADNRTAIRAVTGTAASAMGIGHETGRVTPGMRADLLIVEGDPLTQISDLGRVLAVVTEGRFAVGP